VSNPLNFKIYDGDLDIAEDNNDDGANNNTITTMTTSIHAEKLLENILGSL